ncbi:MAG: hypothetical protein R3B74_02790 [Nitrospirales bacterium]|nr:hypothetical protein [Nitrospirales bacterium]
MKKNPNTNREKNTLNFEKLFQVLLNQVTLIEVPQKTKQSSNKFRKGIPGLTTKNGDPDKTGILRAIQAGEKFLPLKYHEAYIQPLKNNLDYVIHQAPYAIEDLIGPVYDLSSHVEDLDENFHWNLSDQTGQFLAVVSNFYRMFLESKRGAGQKLEITNWLPPLATFRHSMPFPKITPYTFPAHESALLFGGKVGIVVLPASYREHPLLWSALAHEVGGHDILHIVPGLLSELERKVSELSFRNGSSSSDNKLLRQLWRYWIGEAASDICGVLFMGPTYALAQAIYIAVLNEQLNPVIGQFFVDAIDELKEDLKNAMELEDEEWKKEIKGGLTILANKGNALKELKGNPVLNTSPRPPDRSGEISYHPSDILRLYTMIGALEATQDMNRQATHDVIQLIEDIIVFCKNSDDVLISGFIQTGSDAWLRVEKTFPLSIMKAAAKKVGQCVVKTPLASLNNNAMRDLVNWDEEENIGANEIKNTLLKNSETNDIISNMGSDAQLLAGATLAIFENPDPFFYTTINERLAEALQKSFDRDEVWGESATALVRVWSPPG